jgi:hypothetical protein
MRRVLALVALLFVSAPSYAADCGSVIGWVGVPVCADLTPQVAVPSVVGEVDAAAADTILQGDGLDLGVETESCSAAADNEILRQNPAAGSQVDIGTLVDVVSSNGVPCTGPPLSIDIKSRLGL